MFPVSAKKCEKCKIHSGIFALNFCEVRRFFSCQKPAFLFSVENRRQLWFMVPRPYLLHKACRTLGYLWISQTDAFFFSGNDIERENKMPLKPKLEQKIVTTDQERLKSSGIFTLSSECSHHFRHLRSR